MSYIRSVGDTDAQDEDFRLCVEQNGNSEACRQMVYSKGIMGDAIQQVSDNLHVPPLVKVAGAAALAWVLLL